MLGTLKSNISSGSWNKITIATLIMSAALPWMGALMALRSAKLRTVALCEVMSGR